MGFFDEKEKIYSFSNEKQEGTITIGRFAQIRTTWRINNRNWNYPIDYHRIDNKNLIAVIGDSYIEAFQVDVDQNYPYLLKKKLYPDYEVYAFGVAGYPLSQYLHISRYVNKYFNPDILVFNMVHNDFDESIQELYPHWHYFKQMSINDVGSITETTPIPDFSFPQYTRWKRYVYKSALFRYLYLNLKISEIKRNLFLGRHNTFEANIKTDTVQSNEKLIFRSTDYLVRKIREENDEKRIIFVLDAPRQAIYSGKLDRSNVLFLHEMMKNICALHNVELIDLTDDMKIDYQINKQKFNSEIDGHWNEYGHGLVADVLYNYLTKKQ